MIPNPDDLMLKYSWNLAYSGLLAIGLTIGVNVKIPGTGKYKNKEYRSFICLPYLLLLSLFPIVKCRWINIFC